VIANNYNIAAGASFQIAERYSLTNPPFIYEDGTNLSPVKVYVWRNGILIYSLTLPN
jgi:hypothetical protein